MEGRDGGKRAKLARPVRARYGVPGPHLAPTLRAGRMLGATDDRLLEPCPRPVRPSPSLRGWLLGLGCSVFVLIMAVRAVTHVSKRPRWLVPGLALTSVALVVAAGSVPRRDP